MIRMEEKQKFEYLLSRGILPSSTDSEGCNALHYAIRNEKLEFLSFMLESDYQAHENDHDLNKLQLTLNNISTNKSFMYGTHSNMHMASTSASHFHKTS